MTKKANTVVEAILEIADDQLRTGLIDKAEHEKITLRHLLPQTLGARSQTAEVSGLILPNVIKHKG